MLASNLPLDAPKHIFLMLFMLTDRRDPTSFFKVRALRVLNVLVGRGVGWTWLYDVRGGPTNHQHHRHLHPPTHTHTHNPIPPDADSHTPPQPTTTAHPPTLITRNVIAQTTTHPPLLPYYPQPYYDILPRTLANMPIFWSPVELGYLQGSYLLTQIEERKAR